MISVDTKTPTQTSASPFLLPFASEEGDSKITLTFSELLKGLTTKDNEKIIQNGSLVLALGKDVKATKKSEDVKEIDVVPTAKAEIATTLTETPLELNPQLTQNLTPKELKSLVSDAKKYLKTKIIESEGFKKAEIQKLPKTLKGLVAVAKKFGLDMSKITIEEIKVDPKITAKLEKPEILKAVPQKNLKDAIAHKEVIASKEVPIHKEAQVVPPKTLKDAIAPKEVQVVASKTLKDVITPKEVHSPKEVPEHKEAPSVPPKVVPNVTVSKIVPKKMQQHKTEKDTQVSSDANILNVREEELPKKIKSTPLFKAQTKVELSTQEMVHTKINTTIESKTPKQKADETLKMLLRGEKVTKKESSLTADFSVATARVIAPQATTDAKKSLESLLKGEHNDSSSSLSKTDGFNVAKADSFEVKIHEAKQMTKYLSQDVKTAIEDYKSPFTRVKVQLNPQRLGEIDLTIVQRGKNLHINLSSNNVAVNTLAMNAQDLKVQLANNGINNATLNFNNNASDSSQSSFSQQQQNPQHGREAKDEYNYFDNEEKNEEILNSLEIVVPNYA